MRKGKTKRKEQDELEVVVEVEPVSQTEQDRIGRRILEILISKVDEKERRKKQSDRNNNH
jgi:tRNA(Ser,Leu) C12 N-acetylase TAN1